MRYERRPKDISNFRTRFWTGTKDTEHGSIPIPFVEVQRIKADIFVLDIDLRGKRAGYLKRRRTGLRS